MKEFQDRPDEIELTIDEQNMLVRELQEFQPKKILEVGVFRGGISRLILNNIPSTSTLFSIDLCDDEKVGELCKNDQSINKDNWKLFTGKWTYEVIEKIGHWIDFVFLDTDHVLPGEILDFLMIYPFLKHDFKLVLHDTSLSLLRPITEKNSIAPRLLSSTFFGIKKEEINMTSIQTTTDFVMPINLLNLLYLPWENLSALIKMRELYNFFDKYYGLYIKDFSDKFEDVCKFQFSTQFDEIKKRSRVTT